MKRFICSLLPLFLASVPLLAQDETPTPYQLTDKQAAGLMVGVCGAMLIPMLISLGLWLWIAIWIMKDSKRRQSPNRTLVVVLGWLIPLVGLIVHLVTRPKDIPGPPNP